MSEGQFPISEAALAAMVVVVVVSKQTLFQMVGKQEATLERNLPYLLDLAKAFEEIPVTGNKMHFY